MAEANDGGDSKGLRLVMMWRHAVACHDAAKWLANHKPGTPVPVWVDEVVNGAAPELGADAGDAARTANTTTASADDSTARDAAFEQYMGPRRSPRGWTAQSVFDAGWDARGQR